MDNDEIELPKTKEQLEKELTATKVIEEISSIEQSPKEVEELIINDNSNELNNSEEQPVVEENPKEELDNHIIIDEQTTNEEPIILDKKLVVESSAPNMEKPKKKNHGGIIILLLLLILAVCALYYLAKEGIINIPYLNDLSPKTTTTTTVKVVETFNKGPYVGTFTNCQNQKMNLVFDDDKTFALSIFDTNCNALEFTGTYEVKATKLTLKSKDILITGTYKNKKIGINYNDIIYNFTIEK